MKDLTSWKKLYSDRNVSKVMCMPPCRYNIVGLSEISPSEIILLFIFIHVTNT